MRSLPEDNLKYPVRIKLPNGSGSGFYLATNKGEFYLVTAAHVLYKSENGRLIDSLNADHCELVCYEKSDDNKITHGVDFSKIEIKKDLSRDVALLKLAKTGDEKLEFCDGVVLVSPQSNQK